MKGGVTSGIVYPKAIGRLAAHYHFKNIGGSSAGAIAALEQSPAPTDWEVLIDLAGLDKAQALRAMCTLLKQFADDFMPRAQRLAFVAIPEPELRVRPAL